MMLNRVKLHKTHQFVSPVRGRLLIAEPFAQDIYFSRSIVLLVDFNHEGYMGLVLNKPLDKSLNHLFAQYGLPDFPIYRGGPVDEDRLFYLHNISKVDGAVKISDQLYVGGDIQQISECLKKDEEKYSLKFFMGYSGWSLGQLKSEIKEESWVVSHVNIDIFEAVKERAWRESLLALNDQYFSMWLNFPYDPMSN
jgi:putative transcriptional regulator